MPQATEGQFMASVQNFIIETEQIVSFRKFARLDTHSIRMEDASMDQGWQHGPRMAAWTSRGPACILNTRSSTAFDYFPWHGGRTVRMRNRLNWARVAARTHGCRSNYIPPHSTLEHLGWLDGHTAPLAKTLQGMKDRTSDQKAKANAKARASHERCWYFSKPYDRTHIE